MVWRCAECDRIHETDEPPCLDCGHETFVPINEAAPGDAPVREEIVWVCPECGREHQRNSPPCRRCGQTTLEKRTPNYADVDASGGTSYFDVLEPRYALGYLAVIGFIILVALSMAGIVSVPFLGEPRPPGAPGDAGTYANVSLAAVEDSFVEAVNSERSAAGIGSLKGDSRLEDAATAINHRRVRSAVDGGTPPDPREIVGRYDPRCDGEIRLDAGTDAAAAIFASADGQPSPATVADRLSIAPGAGATVLTDDRLDRVGVDVHVAPDETVFSTVLVC